MAIAPFVRTVSSVIPHPPLLAVRRLAQVQSVIRQLELAKVVRVRHAARLEHV
jgi:hypothetical protein